MRWSCAAFVLVPWALGACAGTPSNVRSQAALDLSCKADDTRIVDAEVGVYLVEGCGRQVSYKCPELATRCSRLFVRALPKPARSDATLTKLSADEF